MFGRRDLGKLVFAGAVGAIGTRTAAEAREAAEPDPARRARRLNPDDCCGLVVDVQDYFLSQLDGYRRSKVLWNTKDFARLLGLFRIPVIATLEKPTEKNGAVPAEIDEELNDLCKTFEKTYFDLSREKPISDHIAGLGRKQIIIAGCETDVCVLQSCLGLLSQGYEAGDCTGL